MPPPPSDRPRGPVVLAVMGGIVVSVVAFVVLLSRPGEHRTPLSRPPGGPTNAEPSAPPPPLPPPPLPSPSQPAQQPFAGPLPAFASYDAGATPTLANNANQEAFEAAVHDVIRRNSSIVFGCYHEAAERDPDLHGRMNVQFFVGENGLLVDTNVTESDVHDERLSYCIRMGLVRNARFPSNPGGRFHPVEHPFNIPPQ